MNTFAIGTPAFSASGLCVPFVYKDTLTGSLSIPQVVKLSFAPLDDGTGSPYESWPSASDEISLLLWPRGPFWLRLKSEELEEIRRDCLRLRMQYGWRD